MTDIHRSKSTISFQRVLVMHAQAIGSNIMMFYQLGDIDGLACLVVDFFLDGRWELCRNHTNSYIHFDISSSQTFGSPWDSQWGNVHEPQQEYPLHSTFKCIYIPMVNLPLKWYGWIRRLDAPEAYIRAQYKMPTQMHHSTSIRINTMANSVAPHRRENATGWSILIICTKRCAV